MFEEDAAPQEEEMSKAKDRIRTKIYVDMYGCKSYAWAAKPGNAGAADYDYSEFDSSIASTPDVPGYEHKSFIPATEVDVDATLPIKGLKEQPLG